MFATRDQENLVNTHQQAAAGKALNSSIRALNPKTPSNVKTPFRPSRIDENRPLESKGQRTVLKGGPSKFDKNVFATPAPRERAPLGQKTANGKANAFKTPAPLQQNGRPEKTAKRPSTARRSARSKIHVAPSEPVAADVLNELEEDNEPDFGYAPPSPIELPDPPIDIPYDQDFPQFRPENMFRGYGELYCTTPTDENGFSIRLKKEEEERKLRQERQDEMMSKPLNYPRLTPSDEELEAQVDAMIAAGPRTLGQGSHIDTVKARSAVALLSRPDPKLPSAAMRPTKASEQKKRPLSITSASRPAPVSVSKNTIGFPKAKAAASIIPKSEQARQQMQRNRSGVPKVAQEDIHPRDFVKLYGQPPEESKMWFRLQEYQLLEDEVKADLKEEEENLDALFDSNDLNFGLEEGDDDDVFQLPMPDD